MAAPYFVADAASVTVLRSLASSVFGKYSLNVPEGIDLEDVHTFGAPGNELAYVGTLTNRRVGGLCRRFVRADVTVTAADKTDPDWVAESDVDEVLQEAAERVASDFFLESDITKAGLGPWVPYEDFAVGDRASIDLWGRRVELPVTRIDPIISDHSVVDWKVHVGGQVVSDEDARIAENAAVQKALVEDRRDLAGLAKQVAKAVDTANAADSKAVAADAKADQAGQVAGQAQATADAAQQDALGAKQSVADLTPKVASASNAASKATADVAALQPQVAAAKSAADKAAQDVSALTPKVTAAQTDAAAAVSGVNTLTPKVTAATQAASKASSDVGALTTRVSAAEGTSAKASSDVSTLTPKVTAAQTDAAKGIADAKAAADSLASYKSTNDVAVLAARTSATTALSDSAKAIDWLKNPVEIGTSLITFEPDTKAPTWTKNATVIPAAELPAGASSGWRSNATSPITLPTRKIRVTSRLAYKVSAWMRADDPADASKIGSAFLLRISGEGGVPALATQVGKTGFIGTYWRATSYILGNILNKFGEWVYTEWEVTFKPEIEFVYFPNITWSYNSTSFTQATNSVADLKIEPIVPTQAQVDQAQNTAIAANTTALAAQQVLNDRQGAWNKAVTDSLSSQAILNEKQAAWNGAVTTAQNAQSTLNAKQSEWNNGVSVALATQKTVNDGQAVWNKAVTDSLNAQSTLNARQTAWNKAVDDATQAQATLNAKQDAWNGAVTTALDTQRVVNEKQGAWNQAVTDSLAAQETLTAKQAVWNQAASDALDGLAKATSAQNAALEALQRNTETNRQLIDGLALNERRRPRPVFAEFKEYKNTYRDPEGFVEIRPYSAGNRGFQFWCLGTWTGEIIVRASAVPGIGPKVLDATRIRVTPENRYFFGTPGAIDMSYVMLDMTIFPQ